MPYQLLNKHIYIFICCLKENIKKLTVFSHFFYLPNILFLSRDSANFGNHWLVHWGLVRRELKQHKVSVMRGIKIVDERPFWEEMSNRTDNNWIV